MVAALLEAMLLLEFLDHRSLRLFGRLPAAGLGVPRQDVLLSREPDAR
jgi:hypothetical protein